MLKLHYLRWVLFDIGADTYFMYQGIFDTDFDKYTEDAVALFSKYGINTVFENLEGFPEDWKSNPAAFVKFVREHQCPSFLEYGEYPYVSADEIKKALRLKAAFSDDARPDAVIPGGGPEKGHLPSQSGLLSHQPTTGTRKSHGQHDRSDGDGAPLHRLFQQVGCEGHGGGV